MNNEKHTTRRSTENGTLADHQPAKGQKLPYEAPRLRSHSRLPVITAGSISGLTMGFDNEEE